MTPFNGVGEPLDFCDCPDEEPCRCYGGEEIEPVAVWSKPPVQIIIEDGYCWVQGCQDQDCIGGR